MPNDDDYAIVVGIATYASYQAIDAAEGDARDFAKWLCDPQGGDLPKKNVSLVLSSDLPPQLRIGRPIRDDVEDEFIKLLNNRVGRIGRRFYFYFSGHGCAPSYDEIALIMANSSKGVPNRNIGARLYAATLVERANFDELVFFLDCCRGVDDTVDPQQPPFKRPQPAVDYTNVKLTVAVGSQIGQLSNAPDSPTQRSFFTEFLLEGLRGAAAAGDQSISVESLMQYVKPKVTAKALNYGKRQVPELAKPAEIIFRKGINNQRLITLGITPGWPRPIELQRGDGTLVRRSNVGDTKLQAVLAPGLYQIVFLGDSGTGEPDVRQIIRINFGTTGATAELDHQRTVEYNV
ncbi:caspase family protein [Bradyrhizobium sp. PMVTL-01]|uniref:caspase family protein n=1 Tax=Bradyrhizobium sp. PMVTL-01 TaxID=3434999 RepID=UPI003F6EDBB0